jgi:hypothetical protein
MKDKLYAIYNYGSNNELEFIDYIFAKTAQTKYYKAWQVSGTTNTKIVNLRKGTKEFLNVINKFPEKFKRAKF